MHADDAALSAGGDVRGRVEAPARSLFPISLKNSSQTKVPSRMDNTGRTSRGDRGFRGTKLSFINGAWIPDDGRGAAHFDSRPCCCHGKVEEAQLKGGRARASEEREGGR